MNTDSTSPTIASPSWWNAVVQRRYAALVADGIAEDPATADDVRVLVTPGIFKQDDSFLRLPGETIIFAQTRASPLAVAGYLLHRVRVYRRDATLIIFRPDRPVADVLVNGRPFSHSRATDWWGEPEEFERSTIGKACDRAEAMIAAGEMEVPEARGTSTAFLFPSTCLLGRWGTPDVKLLSAASERVRQEIAAAGGIDLCFGRPVVDTRKQDRLRELAWNDDQ
ncbi:hypothetical protein [Ancylobacter terrae]|uniref:hypothetical protein n=1 Tax=Ancylobacter sp. sgz301288 TaxID=3342077 RepID=UPI00385AFCC6